MATKYYAPPGQCWALTIATHPGTLTENDVVDNLMRMAVMQDEVSEDWMDSQDAIEELSKMTPEEYNNLRAWCRDRMSEEDFQLFLDSSPLPLNQPLEPITKEEAQDLMDEYSLKGLVMYKLEDDATRE